MQKSLLSLFAITLAASLVDLLIPGDAQKGTRRCLHLLTSLVVLLLVLQPILHLLSGSFDAPFRQWADAAEDVTVAYEEVFLNTVTAGSERDLKKGLYALLEAEYSIGVKDAEIDIQFSKDGALSRVEITLSGRGLLIDPKVLQTEISNKLNCPTEVR